MFKSILCVLAGCLLMVGSVSAQTYHILDTGDPTERVCNPKSYTDLGNGIVRDNVTGLEWQQATAPGTYTLDQANAYVQGLNDTDYLGYNDWRLPNIEELTTLIDNSITGSELRIDTSFFPDTATDTDHDYWSSTTLPNNANTIHTVNFYYAHSLVAGRTASLYVRVVRGSPLQTSNNFVNNTDGTITDTNSALMWQLCHEGETWDGTQCIGTANTYTWDQANAYIQEVNGNSYLGYNDWRLPTWNEIETLFDYSLDNPTTEFPNVISGQYWTSTTYARGGGSDAFQASFSGGYIWARNKDNSYYVRAVRGGECWSLGDWCIDDIDCDDSLFCNGEETCVVGACIAGNIPCIADICNEIDNQCFGCTEGWQCAEGSGCVEDVCVEDNAPVMGLGPFLAAGDWPKLATSESKSFTLNQTYSVLWTFDDDYATCEGEGLCKHRARYRRVDDTKWLYLNVETGLSGTWYALTELPVDRMIDGTYYFQFDLFDCAGQLTTSRTYYFKVAHP